MLKELKIQIIYEGNDYSLKILPEHCNYDKLIEEVKKKIKVEKSIQLMAVNTKTGYQIITKKTFESIMSQKYDDALSIYATESEEEVEEDNDLEANIINVNDDIYADNDLKDDSFDDELENEKSEKKHHFVDRISNNDDNDMQSIEDEIDNDDDKKLESIKNNSLMNKKEDSSGINNKGINNYFLERRIDPDLNGNCINKEQNGNHSSSLGMVVDSNSEKSLSSSSFRIKLESFDNEICSICNLSLKHIKFICCICDNRILCEACEEIHGHPSLKCKTHFLSSIFDYYFYARLHQDIKVLPPFIESAKLSYDITISPKEIEFTMRLNKTMNVPITITNNSKSEVTPTIFTLLIKNMEKLRITYDQSKLVIPKSSSTTINLRVDSGSRMCFEEINLEIYSTTAKLKDKAVTVVMKIEVNQDEEEEHLNSLLKDNDSLKLLSKKRKEAINYIIKEGLSIKSPEDIAKILIKHEWQTEKALDELTA